MKNNTPTVALTLSRLLTRAQTIAQHADDCHEAGLPGRASRAARIVDNIAMRAHDVAYLSCDPRNRPTYDAIDRAADRVEHLVN